MTVINRSPQFDASGSDSSLRLIVLGGGALTTLAALAGVYLLNSSDVHVMGWYLDYIIPIGALLIGLLAGSGYGLASWITGLKIRKGLLWTVVFLQLIAYGAAEYVAFRAMGPLHRVGSDHILTFTEYFDLEARNFAWKGKDGKPGEPLGEWGYFFRGLEIVGFALGGLIAPVALSRQPYCDRCQAYMRKKQAALIGAAPPSRKVKKSDAAGQLAYSQECSDAMEAANKQVKEITDSATAGDIAGYQAALSAARGPTRRINKLPARIAVKLVRCARCNAGYLQSQLITGQGKKIRTKEISRTELQPEVVARMS